MTADREVLREAVLPLLPDDAGPQDWLADVIVDAVLAAEHTKHEWAYRYPNGHVATLPAVLATEEVVRAAVAEHPDLLTVVRRRVGEWEAVD